MASWRSRRADGELQFDSDSKGRRRPMSYFKDYRAERTNFPLLSLFVFLPKPPMNRMRPTPHWGKHPGITNILMGFKLKSLDDITKEVSGVKGHETALKTWNRGWITHTELERVPPILIPLVLKPPKITFVLMAVPPYCELLYFLFLTFSPIHTLSAFLRLMEVCFVLLLNCILFPPASTPYVVSNLQGQMDPLQSLVWTPRLVMLHIHAKRI